jgi:hypothetical protein
MKALNVLFFAGLLASGAASAQTLALKRWAGTELRSPAADVARAIRQGHATLVCWADGVQSLTPRYEAGSLRQVTLHLHNDACGIAALDLVFTVEQVAPPYTVLTLTDPAIERTPLAGYPDAKLVLSLVDAAARPISGGYNEALYSFRLILEHAYDYDPDRYGGAVVTYESRDMWREIALEIVSTRVVDDPSYCDPRFPDVDCRYVITTKRRTSENTLTGERYTFEFEESVRE